MALRLAPLTMPVKCGLRMSKITTATVLVRPVIMLRASGSVR